MDTKDTGIRKQKPTAPGAEGNDGAFPKNNPAEGLTPSPSNVKTVTTSKKVRVVTEKALMMFDGEAGATQHTNQLSDLTLPLMDKVNILLDDNESEKLEEVKPDNRENQNDHIYFKVTKERCGPFPNSLIFHCLQNQNLPPDALTMPVSGMEKRLNPNYTQAFLDLAWNGRRGRVYIWVTGDSQGRVNWEMEAQFQIISKHHVPTRDIGAKVVNKDKKKYRAMH
ncbi:hypothetical protein Pmani_032907 [Petrolisthes manimaculis]|uniref:Uncharacterized protein n=1 Tax=Petrolisthes manimaculis TaxID=1843537 RepID=A0AAE1NQS8_9EUCA|nr:hypothetical protein Pmani_032907 [Petrolisthes manimaculis]